MTRRPVPPPGWPHAQHSRRISCRPYMWHVQEMGAGPTLLMLHGAGASTHSFRALMPLLARHYHVIAPDLPGHGFTRLRARMRMGLDPMAEDLTRLCQQEGWAPAAIIGHSAGGAIALRMTQIMPQPPRALVCINAALENFDGVAGWLFPAIAKALALAPIVPWAFSRIAGNPSRVRELLSSTGSTLDDEGRALYMRLIQDPAHVDGALAMMANWKLEPLLASLPGITLPALFLVGDQDGAVKPEVGRRAARAMPNARLIELAGYGHLAHEEIPERVAGLIEEYLRETLAP
ncbi:alpha/beta fold hydrolase BchO [Phaeovulum vinaykumarii]|uniref:Magnesium chelatase accessory protein n=1 Tax=Phaeovulum vinaykumarii TaxID=407234 RepID=A0A1N7L468_9RHOB|nr:alpha/beta fold hydrolase BchO [Phaeovulum vinaykumarii]SIS68566.1 magnesium chelatase accessory protein [Phaeovulum vinaykumarii]SOB99997.1 magnesium chelatase accessory protein [Phaeovulum vinaykumarii]